MLKKSLALSLSLLLGSTALAADLPGTEAHPNWKVLGHDHGHLAIVNAKGEVEWDHKLGGVAHDLHLLPNGNILLALGGDTVEEISPAKEVVWKYVSTPTDKKRGVQTHAATRLANGNTMISESGNCRLIEVDKAGKIVKEIPLTVEHHSTHSDTRLVRILDNGHYLIAHESDGKVREYDEAGKVVWEYKVELGDRKPSGGHGPEGHGDHLYSAYRLPNGNTLIGGGNNNRVLEVSPEGKVVWSIDHTELPGITFAWITMLEVLPNGNIIIGNCHATEANPQLIEVTRDKKVVWTFKDFKTFGNSLASTEILGIEGKVIR